MKKKFLDLGTHPLANSFLSKKPLAIGIFPNDINGLIFFFVILQITQIFLSSFKVFLISLSRLFLKINPALLNFLLLT